MSISEAFVWGSPPSTIIGGLAAYQNDLIKAVGELADRYAQEMASYMKANAPWNDDTGAARAGLGAVALKAAYRFVIRVFHTVVYGPYLEFGTYKMSPRPILGPTLAVYGPRIMADLRALVGE